tara:strand:- start:11283 stop:13298 length:2016 start_codon:yes stop_codon:yes gene_type:complete
MENLVMLIVLPLVTFVAAWAIASWRAQRNNQQMQTDLQVTQADLARAQAELSELQATQGTLSGEKAALDIAYGRLETERDNGKAQIARLEEDLTTQKNNLVDLRSIEQQAREASAKAQEAADKLKEQLNSNSESFKERMGEKDQRVTDLVQKLSDADAEHKATSTLLAESREASATAQEAADKLKEQAVTNATTYKERIEERDQRIQQLDAKLTTAEATQKQTAAQLAEDREALKKVQTQLDEKQDAHDNYKTWWEQSKAELKTTEGKYTALTNAHGQLKTSLEEKQQHFDAQLQLIQQNREELTKEFERLANEVLERKGKAFKELNHESITNLLNPLHTEMKGFKAKVEDIHAKDAEQRVELRTELKNLQTLNKEITDQADKLTTALQGQKKVQGNWGELMLENVLDNSGLRLGTDYKREVSFTTEEGRQRPDAIVYLPHNQHLIIDAKTSLSAYTQYVNADNDLVRDQALAAHAKAVSDRVNELADRDYYKLPGLNSPEVVIMFIPIESAYVEALKYDETLFQRAIERNVLVATPTTLLTSLNIVRQLWRFEDQNKHTAELANRAEKFYSKLNNFLISMKGIGNQLDKARGSYDKAFGQLYSGKGNLIKQASEFKELGVSVQNELPTDLVERANLELGGDTLQIEQLDAAEASPVTLEAASEEALVAAI